MSTPRHTSQTPLRAVARLAAVLALAAAPAATVPLAPAALAAQDVGAQATGRITGTVTDRGGLPVPNVQVVVVGTSLGGLTADDGRYTIGAVPAGAYQLRAQRIGFAPTTQPVTVAADQTVTADIQITAVATTLTTQVVVGYTTQQRRDVSDAVSSVTGAELRDQTVATVEEAVRGRIPGVQVTASGEPGRAPQILIRGASVLGNPSPLYVVDGMYMQQNPNLNPDDIASVEVLKDASAAAQYGAQAANGVVVITTKRGSAGPNRVELRSYYGFQEVPKTIDMMGAQQWAEITRQAYVNAGRESEIPQGVTDALAGNLTTTDWQDALFQRGAIQDHNLAVSGGGPGASYLISGGYLTQEGSIISTDFNRYSFRANSEARRGIFTFGENLSVSQTNRKLLNNAPDGGVLNQAVRMLPGIPIRDPSTGAWGYGNDALPTFGYNPVALQEAQPRRYRSNQVIGSAYGEARLAGPLRYRLNLGVNYNAFRQSEFNSIAQIRFRSANPDANLTEARGNFTSTLIENLLLFDQQFGGDHRVNAVAGYTVQRQDFDSLRAFRRGFNDEDLQSIDAGLTLSGFENGGAEVRSALEGLLARVNYSFRDRYLFTGSIRRDGSSRFASNNRYGTFGAASVGWVLSEEPFFESVPLLNAASFFKLRGSTGVLGNQDIGDYQFSAILDQRQNYLLGGNVAGGVSQLTLANPNIRWQETRQSDVGLDLGLLEDRLTVTADYYRKTPSGLLVGAPLPPSLGYTNTPTVNAGKMRSTGFELGASHRWERGGLQLNTTATLTTSRNKVLSLGNGGQPIFDIATGVARTAVGQPIGEFYVLKTNGIFQSQAEVDAYTGAGGTRIQPNAAPGDIRYVDVNGDGQITLDDRYGAGNGLPKYSGGVFFDGRFRSFDFGLNLRGAGGFKIFNGVRYWTDRMDDPSNFRAGFSPWTPENPSTDTPRALARGSDNSQFLSDRWIEDGDYLRIQNIVIGYTLPTALTGGLLGNDAQPRIYLNLQNVHTFTDYSNWDPETIGFNDPLGRGIDFGLIYPNVRTVTLGLDLRL